ncbi:MAG: hypothetical protein ABL973_13190 [Micropepsaceae bacterium]
MFIGHYAPALALRTVKGSPGLATGFVAVQLIDVGFFSLSYFGIEKWAANPTITGFTPVDLYFMPYTHSILGTVIWAAVAGGVIAVLAPAGKRLLPALITFALVASHWVLDLAVHRHDLGILGDAGTKLGFGLWDFPLIEMPLELGLLVGGFTLYMNASTPRNWFGTVTPWIVMIALLAAQAVNWFTPPAADTATFSGMGLLAYGVAALLGWLLDATRQLGDH